METLRTRPLGLPSEEGRGFKESPVLPYEGDFHGALRTTQFCYENPHRITKRPYNLVLHIPSLACLSAVELLPDKFSSGVIRRKTLIPLHCRCQIHQTQLCGFRHFLVKSEEFAGFYRPVVAVCNRLLSPTPHLFGLIWIPQ